MPSVFHKAIVAGLLFTGVGIWMGQTQPAATTAATKPLPDLKISLMDGSILSGKLSVPELTVDTKFGPLKVPVEQIQSFAPGLQSHAKFQETLNGLINDLAAEAFADREKAQQDLMKLGLAIKPELERQLKGAQDEKAMRLQKILEEFESQIDDENEKVFTWVKDDVIVTAGFTVVGHITTPGFAIKTDFGTLQVKIEDVRMGKRDIVDAPEEIRKNFAVPGTAIAQRSYLSTGIKVAKGDVINITASGNITMTPWGNEQTSTPDGQSNFGQMQPGIYTGTLIARIGDAGPIMKVGSKATIKAEASGMLQFGIASQGNYPGSQFPGEYQTKIRVTKKQ